MLNVNLLSLEIPVGILNRKVKRQKSEEVPFLEDVDLTLP